MDRASAVQSNVQQLRELDTRYPGKLKLLRSAADVDAVDMDRVMKGGMPRTFDNADPSMPEYVASALADGKKVVVLPAGRQALMVMADHNLFR